MTHAALQKELARSTKPTVAHVESMKEWRDQKKNTIRLLQSANRTDKRTVGPLLSVVRVNARNKQIKELSAEIRSLNESIESYQKG